MPQSSERVNSFLERARACRVAAEMASNAEARATYLDLADSWQTLAKQVGCLDASYEATREAAIAFAKSWRRESGRPPLAKEKPHTEATRMRGFFRNTQLPKRAPVLRERPPLPAEMSAF
jgi:hypothetical protein